MLPSAGGSGRLYANTVQREQPRQQDHGFLLQDLWCQLPPQSVGAPYPPHVFSWTAEPVLWGWPCQVMSTALQITIVVCMLYRFKSSLPVCWSSSRRHNYLIYVYICYIHFYFIAWLFYLLMFEFVLSLLSRLDPMENIEENRKNLMILTQKVFNHVVSSAERWVKLKLFATLVCSIKLWINKLYVYRTVK